MGRTYSVRENVTLCIRHEGEELTRVANDLDLFHLNQTMTPVEDVNAARVLQKDLLRFLHGREFPWPAYGREKRITNFTASGFGDVPLPTDLRARCEMVNRVVLDPRNGV